MKKFLNFETLITPAIIKILYPVLVILFAIRYFWQMIAGLLVFAFGGLSTSFTALASFIAMPFVLRIAFELVLILFRIYEYTFKLANPDKELTGVLNSTDELKKEVNAGRPQQPNFQQQPGYGYGPNPYPPQQPGYPQPGPNQPGYPQQGQPSPYPNQGFAPQQQAPQAQPQQPMPQAPQQPQPAAPNAPVNPNNPQ